MAYGGAKVEKDKIIDVEYNTKEEIIDTETYYTCKHISQLLDVPEETIKSWVKYFNSIIHVPTRKLVKKYTTQNIKQLAFIKKLLMDDGLDLKGAMEHIQKHGFQMPHEIMVTSNPEKDIKAMEAIVDKKMSAMQEAIIIANKKIIDEAVNNITKGFNQLENSNKELQDKVDVGNKEIQEMVQSSSKEVQVNIENIINERVKEQTATISNSLKDYQTEVVCTREDVSKILKLQESMSRKERHKNQKILYRLKNMFNKNK